jgi:Amt family ammonium transporter
MLKNLLDACGAAIAFYTFGYAFAFGGQNEIVGSTFIGYQNFFLVGDVNSAFFFFEYAFSATACTIVAGTLAERCQMAAYLCYSLFLTGLVYPVSAHCLWSNNGYLSAFSAAPIFGNGCIDFAGSGVVHLTGGTTGKLVRFGHLTKARNRSPYTNPCAICCSLAYSSDCDLYPRPPTWAFL